MIYPIIVKMNLKDIKKEEFRDLREIISFFSEKENSGEIDELNEILIKTKDDGPICVKNIKKEQFRKIIVLVDLYNVLRTDNEENSWDQGLEDLYLKLNKKFIRIYRESPYLK